MWIRCKKERPHVFCLGGRQPLRNAKIIHALLVMLLLALVASCKGDAKEKYAAAVAGTAASLAVVQQAKAQSPNKSTKGPSPCCWVCDECSFPCGDRCVPIGTMCAEPKGCACYPPAASSGAPPMEPPPACMQTPGEPPAVILPVPNAD